MNMVLLNRRWLVLLALGFLAIQQVAPEGLGGRSVDCPEGCDSTKCDCSEVESGDILVVCEDLTEAFFACLDANVIEFQLHRSSLKSISKEDFVKAKNLRTLDISYNQEFTTIEEAALTDVVSLRRLYLDNNALTELDKPIFPVFIEDLRLNRNKLTKIEYETVFGDMALALSHLSLSHNNLEEFACAHLDYLVVLELQGNRLRAIKDDDFRNCSRLEELYLAGNLIKEVNVNWTVVPDITFLDFSFNEIAFLGTAFHSSLTRLKYLWAARNVLREVPTLPGGLIGLDFNGNHFKEIRRDAFRSLSGLAFLDISDMPFLESVEEDAFAGLASLFSLRLQNNRKLRVLPKVPWPNSEELREIHLSNNAITEFHYELFSNMDDLWVAVIAGNPLHCSCDAAWIRAEMDSSDNRWIEAWTNGTEAVVCHSPENLSGFYVSELNTDDLTCERAILQGHSQTLTPNAIILEAMLSRGVPSTSWFLPDGRQIVAKRSRAWIISALTVDPFPEEILLENLTIVARLTIFAGTEYPHSFEYGKYVLEYRTAGGPENYTFEVGGPQSPSPAPSGGGSHAGEVVAVVVVLSLVMVVLLAVGAYFGYRYVKARRQSRYHDIGDEERDSTVTSSSEQHVQELPETISPFNTASTGYGSTS